MRPRTEDGFALPLTIFVVSIVTLMLAAVFVRVSVDRRVGESSGDIFDALNVAQCGLYRSLDTWSAATMPPNDGDSLFFNSSSCFGGNATVFAHLVRRPSNPLGIHLFIIRSTGTYIIPTLGADPQATRTVAQFAQWQTGTMDVLGALTAANGLQIAGSGIIDIDGSDGCATAPSTAGLRVPLGPALPGPPSIDGTPPVIEADNEPAVAGQTNIDWVAITTGGFEADYSSLQPGNMTYPSQLVTGDLVLTAPTTGTGLLIVTGDLNLSGPLFQWNGVIIVGGQARFNTDLTFVYGQMTTGLNRLLGTNPPRGDVGVDGTSLTVRYDSCNISAALASLTGFAAIPNAWFDSWATY